ncbi:MAG: hypothetical protein Q9195_001202 [Heterodermia aff. obscurata]
MSPNALKRKRPTRSSTSSSSPSVTTPPNHPSLSPMPSSSHTSGHTVTVRQPTLAETVEQYQNIMANSSIPPTVSARPPVKRMPPLSCGLLRGTPAALSGHQDMYYSERSYIAPMTAPSPDAIAAEIDKFRSFQAALSATGTAETAAQKRRRKADERVFAYRREATYRILEPEIKNMNEPEASLPAVSPPTPRISLRSTPPIPSPVPVAQPIEETEPLAAPPVREQTIKLEGSDIEMLEDHRIEAPESIQQRSDDEENYEGAEPTGYTESSNDDEDNYDDMSTYEFTEEWSDSDDEDENSTVASKTPARDEDSARNESSNTEVMTITEAMNATETESQRSTPVKHSDSDSDRESNYSNFSDEYQSKRETRLELPVTELS